MVHLKIDCSYKNCNDITGKLVIDLPDFEYQDFTENLTKKEQCEFLLKNAKLEIDTDKLNNRNNWTITI